MCFKKLKFTSNETEISISELTNLLNPLELKTTLLWDSRYFYVSHEGWGKVFGKVLLDMPKYTVEKFDCENFAVLVSARTSELFQLNTCGIAIGQSPQGYHGFNIFLSDNGFFYLEPQTGDVYSVTEDSGYKAELVIFG